MFIWSLLDRALGRDAGEANYGSAMPYGPMAVQNPQSYLQLREESHHIFISTSHRIWAGPGEGA